jgi:2-polyprenyl-3-methyl-5-hydroxy-6-metoxy-1,4-benzoquinol methylase
MKVLDAGCGIYDRYAEFGGAEITGIDVLESIVQANPGLNHRLVGDITNYAFPESYDIIMCECVLEHLPDPYAALDNLVSAVAPGGQLRLSIPSVLSPKSLVAKFTPQWFHLRVYRHVFRFPHAGEPEHGPFPTHLRWSLKSPQLFRWAANRKLEVASVTREKGKFRSLLITLLMSGHTDINLVLIKPSRG